MSKADDQLPDYRQAVAFIRAQFNPAEITAAKEISHMRRMQICVLIFSLAFFISGTFSQELKKPDFKVDCIELAGSLDSVTIHLGKAKRIEKLGDEWDGITVYSYAKLNIWLNDDNSSICAFDFSDSSQRER
jgi:hypothetical protein